MNIICKRSYHYMSGLLANGGMKMKLKVQISPNIFNFPHLYNETIEIEEFVHELTKNTPNLDMLPEWTIIFLIHLEENKSPLGIYKKGAIYPSYPPEKMYMVHLPIPTNKEIRWGVDEKDFWSRPTVHDVERDIVEGVEFCDFDNLSSYIIESSKMGIEQLLRKGISLKGVKIKI